MNTGTHHVPRPALPDRTIRRCVLRPSMGLRNVFPKGYEKSPQEHYDCLTLDQLKALRDPIVFATAPHAVCIKWGNLRPAPGRPRPNGTWGFQFKTGGPWIKRTGNGNPAMGTRYVLRSAAELFLIGTLGAPRTKNKGQETCC